jgi:hypothetical protein
MSDDTNTPAATPPAQEPNRPSHIAYSVRQDSEGNSHSNRIGAAFEHTDKAGFTVQLSAPPVDGRVMLRAPRERLENKRSGERSAQPGHDQAHEK